MIDGAYVIDAVGHSYNLDGSNFAHPDAEAITQMLIGITGLVDFDGYAVSEDAFTSDWPVQDTVNATFRESRTDFLVYHPTPISAFKDGLVAVEKAAECVKRWPNRVLTYATVDPLAGESALEELDRQVELFDPIGLKLYPSSWREGVHRGWRMDDPTVAFPVFERARELGIKMIAIHKNIPFGPIPRASYAVDDMDVAAASFPDLNFEIVHGGMAFLEDTAWVVGRFPNVFINFEGLHLLVALRPAMFQEALVEMCSVGGPDVLNRCFWATGTHSTHPRPFLEAFVDFQFDPEQLERQGLLHDMPQLTWEDKKGILGENYARAAGLDMPTRLSAIEDDEFSGGSPNDVAPWSTTSRASEVTA